MRNVSMSSPPSAQLRTGAGTHNHQCLLMRSLWPELWPNNEHWWLWVPDRARCARLSGTTWIECGATILDSIFKQPILRTVIARSEATKQSILPLRGEMDCFASLAMTVSVAAPLAMTSLQFQIYLRILAARGARGFARTVRPESQSAQRMP